MASKMAAGTVDAAVQSVGKRSSCGSIMEAHGGRVDRAGLSPVDRAVGGCAGEPVERYEPDRVRQIVRAETICGAGA